VGGAGRAGTVAAVTATSGRAFTVGPRAQSSDGVGVATYELGGDGPPLLLAHATGFHALVWLPLAAHLRQRFRCIGFDLRGHGASDKDPSGTYDWHGFAVDTLAVVDELGLGRVSAVGHSCGGAALLLAEQAEPGRFRSLYCWEPVVFEPEVPGPLDETQPLSAKTLAPSARRRREVFPSRDEAYANYLNKPPFSTFDPAAVRVYVDYGFEDLDDGTVRLRCRGEDEARIYEAAPHHGAWSKLGLVETPTTLACGGPAAHIGVDSITAMAARMPRARTEAFEDLDHFGPLERPAAVAASIIAAIDASAW
jgi:pimeloyl-ACP methyl ester carboxylesterase